MLVWIYIYSIYVINTVAIKIMAIAQKLGLPLFSDIVPQFIWSFKANTIGVGPYYLIG